MKTLIASAVTLLLTSPMTMAAPTVADNTISWPDNGWYQVQTADTYESICGGTRSCVVEPGEYIVINHTTGERFERILVGQTNDPDGPIKVSGSTISWPDNGWYQVQWADTYVTICNGGSSCDVENGLFTVINHSTGERFRNVRVNAPASVGSESGLETLGSSDEFYTALKQALIERNDALNSDVFFVDEEFAFDSDALVSSESADAPVDASSADSVNDSAALTGLDVTSTNVQELGVDEQDRVKVNAAGTQLFVLNNNYPYEEFPEFFIEEPFFDIPVAPVDEPPEGLFEDIVIDAPDSTFPDGIPDVPEPVDPDMLTVAPDADSPFSIDEPLVEEPPIDEPFIDEPFIEEPFIDEPFDISIPFIEQSTTTTLRILALDADTPDASSINDLTVDLDGREADGLYLYENDGQSSAIITAAGNGYWYYWGSPESFSGQQSVIAKVDVTDAANAALTDTFTIDGQIISSRRIGDALFFASRYYPAIPGVEPWGQSEEEWREAVEAADLSTLMPEYSRDGSEEGVSLVDAAECFVAPGTNAQPFYSPDIITLGVIDLATMQLRDSECFLGATETLYANTESVFLATTQYDYSQGPQTLEGETVDIAVDVFDGDIAWFDPRTTTDIHQFDIDSDQLSYAGSGTVEGHLGWNDLQKPFRMSERDGYLRVATMNDQQGPEHSPILLTILKSDGQGTLQTVSKLPNDSRPEHIGKRGERLYASRFLGDRAYLVTFRQTDPLYVVDLSNPEDPAVKGELEIEGYSDYLQPVGEGLLLGIGKNAVAADDGFGDGRGAWVQGMKLSLFDVSDPAVPTEVTSVLLGERGTDSNGLYNHRAITIQPANEQHPMRVSFGVDVYGDASPTSTPAPDQAFEYYDWNYSGLHGFDITVGANADIIPRGSLIVDRNNGSNWQGYGDDRAVMVNDAVFYIYGKNVYPALWDNLGVEPQAR